jgi:hypothetical protein
MISICFPTRGRPEVFKIMCLSALNTASDPNDIEFVTYHDDDDTSPYKYFGNHKEVIGKRIIHSQMHNECQKVATGPIYMFAADDVIFYTKGWDKYVKEIFNKSTDKILFVHPNDENFGSKLGVMGFLHKNWIDTVGYLLPPYFAAWNADNWVTDLAVRINRKVFLPSVIVKHLDFEEDRTHVEYIKKIDDALAIYNSKEWEREKDAQLLQNFINKYLPKCCTEMDIKVLDLFFPSQMNPKEREFIVAHGIYEFPLGELVRNAVDLGNGKIKIFYRSKQLRGDGTCAICESRGGSNKF